VCYLALTGVVLVLGREHVYPGGILAHFAVLLAIAAATFPARIPSGLRAWVPIAAIVFLYTELPMIIRSTGYGRFFDQTVISWETALFGGQPALEWAIRWPSLALSELLHVGYLSYYAIILSVPVALWVTRRRSVFPEAVFTLLLVFVACFVCFIAFPVEGPRYLWPGAAEGGPVRRFTLRLLEAGSSRGTAFPSSHVAVATAQSLLAWRYFGWRAAPVGILTFALALGAIYGGFHYAIDVIAGAVFGLLLALAGLELFRLLPQPPTNATAPTYPVSPAAANDSSTSSSGTAST
jgi:membrane-associated phospholipid phosphatase